MRYFYRLVAMFTGKNGSYLAARTASIKTRFTSIAQELQAVNDDIAERAEELKADRKEIETNYKREMNLIDEEEVSLVKTLNGNDKAIAKINEFFA